MAQAYRVRSRIARLIVRGLFAAIFRVRHDGTLPARGPLLVVANHQGWADGFLLAASFPLSADVRLLGDREGTGKVWWWRAVLRAVGIVIPIERASASADRAAPPIPRTNGCAGSRTSFRRGSPGAARSHPARARFDARRR